MIDVILASASPRRSALFRQIGIDFRTDPSNISETFDSNDDPGEIVSGLASGKAKEVAGRHPDSLIIGADTIVLFNGQILGKPGNKKEAEEMLSELNGNPHDVFTGVSMLLTDSNADVKDSFQFSERTIVTFSTLSKMEIDRYIDRCQPFDKAGSYGIQDDMGALFVEKIEGDYYNVVGFPLNRFYRELQQRLPHIHRELFFSR